VSRCPRKDEVFMNSLMRDMAKPDTLKAAAAELVGTFFLTLATLISGTPYAVGLTLIVFVYAFGNISGCNINPAVTVGLLAARRLPLATGIVYIVAQVVGALLARGLAGSVATLPSTFAVASFAGEFLGFGFLMLAVIADSDNYVPKSGSGIAIGGALAAGLVTTKGILNPAVAIAMGQLFSLTSLLPALVAPLVSAAVFSRLFLLFAPKAPEQEASSDASDSEDEQPKPKPKQGSASKPAPGAGSRRPTPGRGNGATGKRTSSSWRPKLR